MTKESPGPEGCTALLLNMCVYIDKNASIHMSISGTKHVPKLVPTERAELFEPIPNVFLFPMAGVLLK